MNTVNIFYIFNRISWRERLHPRIINMNIAKINNIIFAINKLMVNPIILDFIPGNVDITLNTKEKINFIINKIVKFSNMDNNRTDNDKIKNK